MVDQVASTWNQGDYFQAGVEAVDVAEFGLIAKAATTLVIKTGRRGLHHGRDSDSDIDYTKDPRYTSKKIGDRAEVLALQRLHAMGFKNAIPLQNRSNQGIDIVCTDRDGGILVIEVKGHRAEAPLRLSEPQVNMKKFTESRLEIAAGGEGRWASAKPEVIARANMLLDDIKDGVPFRGIVIDIQYAVSSNPRMRFYHWYEKGVGVPIHAPGL
jgi:Holliday junction resolvase-like predicted endonuclease